MDESDSEVPGAVVELTDQRSQHGYGYWDAVWAAWCPTCEQETMPFPSGRCGFCDNHLAGQRTRGAYDPPLTHETDLELSFEDGTPTAA